ncbi:MAG: ABC transporter ATP-binding protein [Leptospirales bacterium]|nr:ABC transporter ATP-binding protein [Leptospirales bacterium]
MATAIQIENLSKEYRLGTIGHGYLVRDIQAWMERLRGRKPVEQTSYWALRDIDLAVEEGEVLGIIGKNGAGKSTLLKVLSRITSPTKGSIRVRGRIASLLEVGTGFHPELTGRQNIFMNGAILGMKRREIQTRLAEIIDFSGIEQFIDTPVKRYSSGMYVRLAFAVAAHLEPEILVVDEVLAVGDLEFQKKCLGKMKEVSGSGRTILFVSHNLAAVQALCSRAIMLDKGSVLIDSTPQKTIANYMERNLIKGARANEAEIQTRMEGVILQKDPYVRFAQISLASAGGEIKNSFSSREPIHVNIEFDCLREAIDVNVMLRIVDEEGRPIISSFITDDAETFETFRRLAPGRYKVNCVIPPAFLAARTFFLSFDLLCIKTEHIVLDRILEFEVVSEGHNGIFLETGAAFVRPSFSWSVENQESLS